MWVASFEKISTIDALRRKGLILTNICNLCKKDGESMDHILMHCPFSWEVWFEILRDFGVRWVCPRDLKSLLAAWRSKAFSGRGNKIWRLALAAICWAIWLERNSRVFEGYEEPSFQVYKRAKEKIAFWAPLCKRCEDLRLGDLVRNWNDVIGCSPIMWWVGPRCWAGFLLVSFFLSFVILLGFFPFI